MCIRDRCWTYCGEKITLAVQDHGPGIPDAEKARVFYRFYSADPSRTDTVSYTHLDVYKRQLLNNQKPCYVASVHIHLQIQADFESQQLTAGFEMCIRDRP